jgi:hypothetical protein
MVVRGPEDPTGAGTVISNRTEATYPDDTGSSYEAVTETVTVTVMHVATIVVTPDETESSDTVAPRDQVTALPCLQRGQQSCLDAFPILFKKFATAEKAFSH